MKIACIGWGSLIWDPRQLFIDGVWRKDGPLLPIEFARQSQNGRLTLVITENSSQVQALYSVMSTGDLDIAIESLRQREGTPNIRNIGFVISDEKDTTGNRLLIQNWLNITGLDAAIWTNLSPRFNNETRPPSLNEAINYLNGLRPAIKTVAEEYIRRAPKQIETHFRKEFERLWGWTYLP